MSDQHPKMPKLPKPGEVVITQDSWAQIASHLPMTAERRAQEDRIAAERQQGVEDLLCESEYPTNRLRSVRRLVPPSASMAMRDVYARYDGAMVVRWRGDDGTEALTIETESDSLPGIDESCFPRACRLRRACPRWTLARYRGPSRSRDAQGIHTRRPRLHDGRC